MAPDVVEILTFWTLPWSFAIPGQHRRAVNLADETSNKVTLPGRSTSHVIRSDQMK